jgi:biopolymer transport protein ExbB
MEFSLSQMWSQMGPFARAVVIVLFLMSVYLVAVTIERWRFFQKNKRRSIKMVVSLRELMEAEGAKALEKASELAKSHEGVPLANVVEAASVAFLKKPQGIDALDLVMGINRAVERAIERQTNRLKRGFGGIATIASTAPFVGLFGTVLGIINAFQSMAKTGSGGLSSVSAGIAEALVTTAFGLLVAIPAVALYNYFTGVVDKMVVDMDEVASEMVEAVVLRGK